MESTYSRSPYGLNHTSSPGEISQLYDTVKLLLKNKYPRRLPADTLPVSRASSHSPSKYKTIMDP